MAPALTNALEFVCQGHVRHGAGHLPADDELFLHPENADPYAMPYRTMRATNMHTLLKFKAGYDCIKDMLPALRRVLVDWRRRNRAPINGEAFTFLPWPSRT